MQTEELLQSLPIPRSLAWEEIWKILQGPMVHSSRNNNHWTTLHSEWCVNSAAHAQPESIARSTSSKRWKSTQEIWSLAGTPCKRLAWICCSSQSSSSEEKSGLINSNRTQQNSSIGIEIQNIWPARSINSADSFRQQSKRIVSPSTYHNHFFQGTLGA